MTNEKFDPLKAINDASLLYDGDPKRDILNGKFLCPVCNKAYVHEASVLKHMAKRDCIDFHVLFEGTTTELRGYQLFVTLINEVNPAARVSLNIFRKSSSFNSIMRLISILMYHNMLHLADLYVAWVIEFKKAKHINQILKYASEPKNLDSFKLDVHAFDLIDNEVFDKIRNQNIDLIKTDQNHFLRLIETCKLSVKYVLKDEELNDLTEEFVGEYRIRFYELMEKVIERLNSKNAKR